MTMSEAKDPTGLTTLLNTNGEALDRLTNSVDKLQERLRPLLRPSPTEPGMAKDEQSSGYEVGDTLIGQTERVNTLNRRIEELTMGLAI